MNLLDIILFIGAGQGILLALLLFSRGTNKRNNRILGTLLGLLALHLVLVGNDNATFFLEYPHLSRITWTLPLLYGPLIFLLTTSLTAPRFKWRWRYLLLFTPFILFVGILMPYYLLPAQEKIAYLSNYEVVLQEDFGWMNQITNVVHVFFLAISLLKLRTYVQRLHSLYSDEQHMRLLWLRDLLWGVFLILAFSVLVFYSRKWGWPLLSAVYPYHFLGVVVLLYWIGYKALGQPLLFRADPMLGTLEPQLPAIEQRDTGGATELKDSVPLPLAVADSTLTDQAAQIQNAMEQDKLYLDPELDLVKLAQHLDMPRYQVSAVLNGVIQKKFYDFVNEYRVAEFQRLAADPHYAHYTLLALAHEAGFNSKSTFNAVFKKNTGQTPSQYYQKQGAKVPIEV
ncbi:AraC family transcriptional regulator [Cesiribacter sp. SM1]|uniref:helix-turn-helix domain-containing protein n=1 Tax=Cesiribacter sp. SM1 TaxID=2861196 RepID=UPI001CD448B6|nr:helix-turn-helix domain-containing protein [Cesiribacter sp. SM1]